MLGDHGVGGVDAAGAGRIRGDGGRARGSVPGRDAMERALARRSEDTRVDASRPHASSPVASRLTAPRRLRNGKKETPFPCPARSPCFRRRARTFDRTSSTSPRRRRSTPRWPGSPCTPRRKSSWRWDSCSSREPAFGVNVVLASARFCGAQLGRRLTRCQLARLAREHSFGPKSYEQLV